MSIIHRLPLQGNSLLLYRTSSHTAKRILLLLLLLSIKKTVNEIAVNIGKATRKKRGHLSLALSSFKVLFMQSEALACVKSALLGSVLGQRGALD